MRMRQQNLKTRQRRLSSSNRIYKVRIDLSGSPFSSSSHSAEQTEDQMTLPRLVLVALTLTTAELGQARCQRAGPVLCLWRDRPIRPMPHLRHLPKLQLLHNLSKFLVKAIHRCPLVLPSPRMRMEEYSEHAYMTSSAILPCHRLCQICPLVISHHPLRTVTPQAAVFLPLRLVLILQTPLTNLHSHHHHLLM